MYIPTIFIEHPIQSLLGLGGFLGTAYLVNKFSDIDVIAKSIATPPIITPPVSKNIIKDVKEDIEDIEDI